MSAVPGLQGTDCGTLVLIDFYVKIGHFSTTSGKNRGFSGRNKNVSKKVFTLKRGTPGTF